MHPEKACVHAYHLLPACHRSWGYYSDYWGDKHCTLMRDGAKKAPYASDEYRYIIAGRLS